LFQIFRPLPRYWISKAIWFLLLGTAAGYLALRYHVLVAIWPGFFAGKNLLELYRLRQMRVELDTQGLLVQIGAERNWIAWNEVVVAQQVGGVRNKRFLELSTQEGSLYVALEFLDASSLWQWVQRYVPPEALEVSAYKRLQAYREWVERSKRLINDIHQPLSASYSIPARLSMGLVLIIMTSGLLLVSLDWSEAMLCLGLPAATVGWVLLSSIFYRLEMTSEAIRVIRLGKRQRMRWDEIDYIQHDFGWHRWVAYGDNKRLAVAGIQMLSGDDQAEMMDMLSVQIEQRRIETRRKERALFTWSRNVS
jgi:hypothetical protein